MEALSKPQSSQLPALHFVLVISLHGGGCNTKYLYSLYIYWCFLFFYPWFLSYLLPTVLADDRHWRDVFRALSTSQHVFPERLEFSQNTQCVCVHTQMLFSSCTVCHNCQNKIYFALLFSSHSISWDISELFAHKLHFCCLELFSNINILHYLPRLSSYFVNIVSVHITVWFH